MQSLQARVEPGCRRCGDLLNFSDDLEDLSFRGMECLACRLAPPDFERAVSFGTYHDELRELIHLLKYEQIRPLARVLGRHLAEAITTLEPEIAQDVLVVAVPLFPFAERARGYNQARLLADEALRALRQTHPAWHLEPAHDLLQRSKRTIQQFALSPRARRRNMDGAFRVAPLGKQRLQGREVLLLDDILTTGATARECSRVLRRAGAKKVWVATVARACGADTAREKSLSEAVARWGEPTH